MLARRYRFRLRGLRGAMTQSDFDFIGQLVQNRFHEPPVRLRPLTALTGWYSVLVAGVLIAGAAIGLAA